MADPDEPLCAPAIGLVVAAAGGLGFAASGVVVLGSGPGPSGAVGPGRAAGSLTAGRTTIVEGQA